MHRRDNVDVKRMLFNEQSQKMALTKVAFSGVARRVRTRGAASLSGTTNQTDQRSLCQLIRPVKTMLRLLGDVSSATKKVIGLQPALLGECQVVREVMERRSRIHQLLHASNVASQAITATPVLLPNLYDQTQEQRSRRSERHLRMMNV